MFVDIGGPAPGLVHVSEMDVDMDAFQVKSLALQLRCFSGHVLYAIVGFQDHAVAQIAIAAQLAILRSYPQNIVELYTY